MSSTLFIYYMCNFLLHRNKRFESDKSKGKCPFQASVVDVSMVKNVVLRDLVYSNWYNLRWVQLNARDYGNRSRRITGTDAQITSEIKN